MSGELHKALVSAAAEWAKKRYPVVLTEVVSCARETPDVMGFKSDQSVLIECKASRSDFHRDKHKVVRMMPENGMGRVRYYCAPTGLLKADDMPNGWGLLGVNNGKARVIHKPAGHYLPCNARDEVTLLVSVLRRVAGGWPDSVSIKCYEHETRDATVSIEPARACAWEQGECERRCGDEG
jgi:hypothetical protein